MSETEIQVLRRMIDEGKHPLVKGFRATSQEELDDILTRTADEANSTVLEGAIDGMGALSDKAVDAISTKVAEKVFAMLKDYFETAESSPLDDFSAYATGETTPLDAENPGEEAAGVTSEEAAGVTSEEDAVTAEEEGLLKDSESAPPILVDSSVRSPDHGVPFTSMERSSIRDGDRNVPFTSMERSSISMERSSIRDGDRNADQESIPEGIKTDSRTSPLWNQSATTLRQIADGYGVAGVAAMSKAQLVVAIEAAQDAATLRNEVPAGTQRNEVPAGTQRNEVPAGTQSSPSSPTLPEPVPVPADNSLPRTDGTPAPLTDGTPAPLTAGTAP